ncbi:MAG: hypothetical protein AAF483_02635 [Planctomycetota bacterium]
MDTSCESIASFFPEKQQRPNAGWNKFFAPLFAQHLIAMEEQSLFASERTSKHTYRFVSIERPGGVVRVESDGTCVTAVCKRIGSIIDEGRSFVPEVVNRELTGQDWVAMSDNIDLSGFWTLSLDGEAHGLDGCRYIVEARVGDRYNIVDRWCPPGPFSDLCNYFLNIHNQSWGICPPIPWKKRMFASTK